MKWNEFDDSIKDILDRPVRPSEGLWQKIDSKLSAQHTTESKVPQSTYRLPVRGIAATVALLVVSGVAAYIFINQDEPITNITLNQSDPSSSPTAINPALPVTPQDVATSSQPQVNTVSSNALSLYPTATATAANPLATTKHNAAPSYKDIHTAISSIAISGSMRGLPTDVPVPSKLLPSINLTQANNTTPNNGLQYKPEDIMLDAPALATLPQERTSQDNREASLAISGGYHYNNILQGASIALNAHKSLNKKIYLDASVGLLMNNPSAQTNEFSGDFLALKRNANQSINSVAMTTPLFQSANGLAYLQVNPSVGYNISKKAKMAIGMDMQQLLNTTNDVVLFKEYNAQLLPRQDFGITSTIEYSINDRISAALSGREGINSLVHNDANIANRRYLQLLMKLKLFKKKK